MQQLARSWMLDPLIRYTCLMRIRVESLRISSPISPTSTQFLHTLAASIFSCMTKLSSDDQSMANVGTEPEHSVIFVAGDDFNFDDDPTQSQRHAIDSAAQLR